MTGCGMLKGGSTAGTTNSTATTAATTEAAAVSASVSAGQAAGNALNALYTQYKADGKYDYKNINNAVNATLLLANCADLPKNVKNTTYMSEFAQGLMASSAGLVTKSNVNTVTDNLTNLATEYAEKVATSETTTKAASTANSIADKLTSAANTASSISSLLSLFSGK